VSVQPHIGWTRIASILWFPVFFAIALPITFEAVYHDPKPRHVPIAVVGTANQVQRLEGALRHGDPGGCDVRPIAPAAAAAAAVTERKVAATYVVGAVPTLYVARAAAPLRATYLQGAFGSIAAADGTPPPRLVDTVPLRSGDGGLGVFFFVFPLMMTGVVTAIVLLQLPWEIHRRVVIVVVIGLVGALATYLTAVGLKVLPGKPLLLLYAFALTQVYGLLLAGLAPLVKQLFLPVSLTMALILSVPSSGGTVATDMMPALFRDLSYVLPLAQGVRVVRGVAYFHDTGLAQATLVLGAWAVVAVAAVAAAWRAQLRTQFVAPEAGIRATTTTPVRETEPSSRALKVAEPGPPDEERPAPVRP
jgi:hypothetical protein